MNNPKPITRKSGFTLIELMMVIAVIMILASMLLPVLGRSKEKARIIVCVSNFRQIGIAMQSFITENSDKFPARGYVDPIDKRFKSFKFALGGKDPKTDLEPYLPPAEKRPLHYYTAQTAEVFKCPVDGLGGLANKGANFYLTNNYYDPSGQFQLKPTSFEAAGCSYIWNISLDRLPNHTNATKVPAEPGMPGKRADWVDSPSRFILMHEPPARRNTMGDPHPNQPPRSFFFHWHFRKNDNEVTHPNWGDSRYYNSLTTDRQQFISPILFVDGHSAVHDFTQAIRSDPDYPYEPTKDWQWYKPVQ